MKKLILTAWLLVAATCVAAQPERHNIAVFDPTSSGTSIDDGTKIAIREIISSTIVNTGLHTIVERSLLEKVMQEQQFTNSGIVAESDATEIGKMVGANKIILSVVTMTGGRNMLSIKIIDTKTANIERQKVKLVASGELLDVVEPMTLDVIGLQGMAGSGVVVDHASAPRRTQPAREQYAPTVMKQPTQVPQTSPAVPPRGEVVLYMPAGFQTRKEKHEDLAFEIRFDKEKVGGGVMNEGFYIHLKDVTPDDHKVKFGTQTIKIDTRKYSYFEFRVNEWRYLGMPMFTIVLKECK